MKSSLGRKTSRTLGAARASRKPLAQRKGLHGSLRDPVNTAELSGFPVKRRRDPYLSDFNLKNSQRMGKIIFERLCFRENGDSDR